MTLEMEMSEGMRKSLADIKAAFGGAPITAVLFAAAMPVRNAAIPKAAYLTGTLRRSIRTEAIGDDAVVVGTDVPYARRIEFGFVGADSRGRRYHQAPRPYLRLAFDETKAEQLSEARRAAAEMLARILK